jgi:hypothetical protein
LTACSPLGGGVIFVHHVRCKNDLLEYSIAIIRDWCGNVLFDE